MAKNQQSKVSIDMNADYREEISSRFTVSEKGDITIHVNGSYDYEIEHERLAERDWFGHISRKAWPDFDFGAFVVAYFHACTKAGLKEVTVDVSKFSEQYYK